jgi:hypothetical protein
MASDALLQVLPDLRDLKLGRCLALQRPAWRRHPQPCTSFARLSSAGGFVWLASGDLVTRNADVHHPYRPASDFFYLAGVAEPGWGCLLDLETGGWPCLGSRVAGQA